MEVKLLLSSLTFAVLCSLLLSPPALGISIGTAPGAMNIGTLERNDRYVVDFYLLTNSENPILTGLNFREPRKSLYRENKTGRYTFIPALASEEDISEWIEFQRKQVVVDPAQNSIIHYPGGVIKADQEATFYIDVPEDAEPGYHAFEVSLSPSIQGGGQGTAVSTIGITRPLFVFKVPGEAKRGGMIQGIAATREDGRARIDVLFRNTGTVTMTAEVSGLRLYNETGFYMKTLKSGPVKVPPKTTKVLKTYWNDDNRNEQKKRRVEATVDYMTGKVSKESMVTIPREQVVQQRMPTPKKTFPWWLIIILVGFALLIIYYWWY